MCTNGLNPYNNPTPSNPTIITPVLCIRKPAGDLHILELGLGVKKWLNAEDRLSWRVREAYGLGMSYLGVINRGVNLKHQDSK